METLTAYHEAGHAIMASCLGAEVQTVTIEPDHDEGPQRYGDTRALWPVGFPAKERRRREIFVLLAHETLDEEMVAEVVAQWL